MARRYIEIRVWSLPGNWYVDLFLDVGQDFFGFCSAKGATSCEKKIDLKREEKPFKGYGEFQIGKESENSQDKNIPDHLMHANDMLSAAASCALRNDGRFGAKPDVSTFFCHYPVQSSMVIPYLSYYSSNLLIYIFICYFDPTDRQEQRAKSPGTSLLTASSGRPARGSRKRHRNQHFSALGAEHVTLASLLIFPPKLKKLRNRDVYLRENAIILLISNLLSVDGTATASSREIYLEAISLNITTKIS
uniref:Uncharacterized protein n=1 Tax=Romanomermis culicivorax TaxID=13658 RepID=A0A915IWK6_ROMCU